MKHFLIIIFSLFLFAVGVSFTLLTEKEACAGGKCHFRMSCLGNSRIKATVCTTDCSSSSTQAKVVQAFKSKMNCSSPSTPTSSNASSGWQNCDIVVN